MAYPDIATNEDLAKELAGHAQTAATLEDLIRYVEAVIYAVYSAGLLDNLPPDEDDRDKHNCACVLLSSLERRLHAYRERDDEREGTDLSIALEVLSKNIANGRFANRRVLEAL
jgi:hypothetical protein